MTQVLFGNASPMMTQSDEDGKVTGRYLAKHMSQSVTRCEMWKGFDDPVFVNLVASTDNDRFFTLIHDRLADEHKAYACGIQELEDVVGVHANGVKPTYVASDDPKFAEALSKHFGCPVATWNDGLSGPTALLTNAGRDALHAQHLSTSAQPAAFNYGALTANSGSGFAASDTTLAGEITTAGGGLIRGQATYAHTAGTNTSTLTKTWAANASDTLPVTVASMGAFNASAAGTLAYEDVLNATSTLNVAGDSVVVTFTLTAG